MTEQEEKICPRCKKSFECKAGNIKLCQCNSIQLTESATLFMESQYNDCLCVQCLQELSELFR